MCGDISHTSVHIDTYILTPDTRVQLPIFLSYVSRPEPLRHTPFGRQVTILNPQPFSNDRFVIGLNKYSALSNMFLITL